MDKYPEFIDPFDTTTANIFVRAEHLARYLHACEYVRKHKLQAVLDAACGNGYGCQALAAQAQSVTGVDRNAALIKAGTERYDALSIQNIRYLAADLNRELTFLPDGSFDCITCFETLEHVESDDALLMEFQRVLRRGGRLLLSVPKVGYEPISADGRPANPFHLRLYSLEQLKSMLEQAGFAVECVLGQPYTNVSRVNMEDFCRDKSIPSERVSAYFIQTPESMEFFARAWGWPVADLENKSNVFYCVCRRK